MSSILALDIGEKRVGTALASLDARLPAPYKTLSYEKALDAIVRIVANEDVEYIVAGLPRNQQDQSTTQTVFTESFIKKLENQVNVPVITQDEALSSVRAREELTARQKPYSKEDVDALAATFILEDYLKEVSTV